MTQPRARDDPHDLFIIGGGINGCGIARDAAGRGLSVMLAEMGDLASATSSASTKLFHGGLRYLEYFEIRLVHEALVEREVLLRAMPHISWPMRFVLPYHGDMRFEVGTPVSRLVTAVMPWMRGRRPTWMIRLGLFLYDHLGGRKILPATTALDLKTDPAGRALQGRFTKAFEYSDCWVDDARLVALNARDAAERGAVIAPRTKVVAAYVEGGIWRIRLQDSVTGALHHACARMLINAAGPWVGRVIHDTLHSDSPDHVRLVRGSHIVTRRLFDHDKCYFLQGSDGRIIFAIPYEQDFTLIGTTDAEHSDPDEKPACTDAEVDYLCAFASTYFARPVVPGDVVWSYSGIRPLYDDGAKSATAATRDYVLKVETGAGAPVLSVFGGKITTYRRLAEAALDQVAAHLPKVAGRWTAGAPLPGGDFAVNGVAALIDGLCARYPFLTRAWAARLTRAYGTEAGAILGRARAAADLGRDFGATLSEAELRWLMGREFARTAEDVVWRRSKLGLRMNAGQIAALDRWMADAISRSDATPPDPAG
ncbi:MAG: glycerol-3-phosphate dehydrogenase [Rhodobacteraceae bacterium]|nr:glycerol-3-phosphate dehydrogenase [Paracoccaceae bacterium]